MNEIVERSENKHNNEKTEMEMFLGELRIARELVGGLAAPHELLNEEYFPYLSRLAPETLETLRGFGEISLANDMHRLDVSNQLPIEVRTWPSENERMFLIAAFECGLFDQAFEMIKDRYQDEIEHGLTVKGARDRKAGFGGV